MIKIITIDDEEPALEEINFILNKNDNVEIIGGFTDALGAIKEIEALEPDAVFMDIEMPEINGFSAAKEILAINSNISIIFITAFDEYAVEAFEVNALDYIMKPVSEERIDAALDKISNKLILQEKHSENIYDKITLVEKSFKRNLDKIIIWKDDEIFLLKPSEIYYFTKENGDIIVVTKEQRLKTKDTLENWENKLSEYNFFRTHRSYLVNLDKVKKMSPWFNNTYILLLENMPGEIPLSRTRLKEFKTILGI
jgi:DNA-binding LytR/AlgR family response regulator